MPAVFLILAAIVQYVMLGRMIKTQRQQIGILKALGFNRGRIVFHYTAYSMVITVLGAILGIILGLMLSSVISKTYAMFFNLPQEIGGLNTSAIISGLTFSLVAGAARVWRFARNTLTKPGRIHALRASADIGTDLAGAVDVAVEETGQLLAHECPHRLAQWLAFLLHHGGGDVCRRDAYNRFLCR